jgi:predicted lysophospholipase L1 biosynthesis ABC-type transport system permease subunit
MIFAKSLLGGVVAAVVMWAIIVTAYMQRMRAEMREHGTAGLFAVAGGWSYLLQKPSVALLLTVAFGIGLYITARISRP